MNVHRGTCESPFGRVLIEAGEGGVQRIGFVDMDPIASDGHALVDLARRQLDEYFAGRRVRFELPLAPLGTPFQQRVWNALRAIDYGHTCSYAAIAQRIDAPRAMRAVGAANGRNPIAIVIPCHRVIGANGTLTGYAGGLSRKQGLLQLEAGLAVA
jgi:methylated-DNA-[protein]-cysteine S-methyltransferase